MATEPRNILVAAFEDPRNARQALAALRQAGFAEDQLGVLARHDETATPAAEVADPATYAEEGAVAGVVAGAGVGGLWGIGIAAGLLPAIGPVIAGGLLASLLASAATGAAAGAALGALIGLGLPEEEARFYESEFQAGKTIVTIRPGDRYDEAHQILSRFGAYDIASRKSSSGVF